MDRPSREGRGRKGDKSGAIALLREVQAGGKKRSEQYLAPDETPIYEEVNDDHYKKLRMADDFVGYTVNYGEDEEVEEEEASKQRALEAQRKKDAKKRGAFNVPTKAKVTEAPAKNTKIPDVLIPSTKKTQKPAAALPPIPAVIVTQKEVEENADEDEDMFAELDAAAEIARVVTQQAPPPQKKARVDEPPPDDNDALPPDPEEALYAQLDLIDPPVQPADPSSQQAPQASQTYSNNTNSAKPKANVKSSSQPSSQNMADPEVLPDAPSSQPAMPSKGVKRPLPPPPPLEALPPISTEPLPPQPAAGDENQNFNPRKEADGTYHFFMLDAADDPLKVPGVVYLFGKVYSELKKKYVSCTVLVVGMERNLFVAPRTHKRDQPTEKVTMQDVMAEITAIRERERISEFRMRPVTRQYVWERPDIPYSEKVEFLQVKYAGNQPALPQNTSGNTFSHIYGTNTTPLETFILKREIKGPSWLVISNAEVTEPGGMRSFTKVELRVGSPRAIKPLADVQNKEMPTLGVMSLNLKTVANDKHQQEVVMCSLLYQQGVNMDGPTTVPVQFTFCAVRKLSNAPLPLDLNDQLNKQKDARLTVCPSERALLLALLNQITMCDPDVLVAHNFYGFDLDVLLHRMQELKIFNWDRLGRLRKGNKMPKLVTTHGSDPSFAQRSTVSGRLVCDTYLAAKDLLRSQKNYSLTELAKTQLGQPRAEFDYDQIPEFFMAGAKLIDLSKFSIQDAYLALQLMHKLLILPLTKQLSNLAGNLWSRSLTGARAERIEYLLLHEFKRMSILMPDKRKDDDDPTNKNANNNANKNTDKGKAKGPQQQEDGAAIIDDEADAVEPLVAGQPQKKKWKKKNRPAYEGGKVLEPKKGYYDKYILLLDFQSLYPSIIQEFNICFTTVPRSEDGSGEPPGNSVPPGLLPVVIKSLVDRRRQVKVLMKGEKDPLRHKQYDIKQQALKLVANSMYGCLGYVHSRFFAVRLAKLITKKGRETLEKTKEIVEKMAGNVDIIYGDTDSIMVNTQTDDYAAVLKIGQELKSLINKSYSRLEIEIDGIFRSLLLLKKKKYAALVVQPNNTGVEKQVKGLEVVRRDWCDLSREMGSKILDIILSGKSREDVCNEILEYLRAQSELIMANKIPLSKYIITKSISKNPEEYPDAKSQPHVQVALKMKAAGKTVRSGDHIQYIICRGAEEGKSAADRAEMPETVKNGGGLYVIDTTWYLEQQILPPLLRHCDPIEQLEPGQIAKALGIAEGRVKGRVAAASHDREADEEFKAQTRLTDEQRFGGIEPFHVACSCGHSEEWRSIVRDEANKPALRDFGCTKCNKKWSSAFVANNATMYFQRYYICEDVACMYRAQQFYDKGYPLCPSCQRSKMRREYSEQDLLKRAQYITFLFDVQHQREQCEARGGQVAEKHDSVYELVHQFLERNARNYVDLNSMFSFKAP